MEQLNSDTSRDPSLFKNLLFLWRFILSRRKHEVVLTVLLVACASLFEILLLVVAVPILIALLSAHEPSSLPAVLPSQLTAWIPLEQWTVSELLTMVIAVVIISAFFRISVLYSNTRFSVRAGLDLQQYTFRSLLHSDFEQFLLQPSSHLVSLLTQKIRMINSIYILGFLSAVSVTIFSISVLAALLLVSKHIVVVSMAVLGGVYLLIATLTRQRISHFGNELRSALTHRLQFVQESILGIRPIKMAAQEKYASAKYSQFSERVLRAGAGQQFYSTFPRPLIEAVVFTLIAILCWVVMANDSGNTDLMASLGILVVASMRLLPFLQQLFSFWAQLIHGQTVLDEWVTESMRMKSSLSSVGNIQDAPDLPFKHNITLNNVSFQFQSGEKRILQDINITIEQGANVGIVGESGAGKTTLVDLIVGMLHPTEGVISVDGVALDDSNLPSWRRQIAYIPQMSFLSSASVAENIALFSPPNEIDWDHLYRCARAAKIDHFIETLPEGYHHKLGNQAITLSGGQRQRLCIARALYGNCKVLVMDESTNALDDITEREVINEISAIHPEVTWITISHSEKAIAHADRVLRVAEGGVSWTGSGAL